MGFIGNLFSSGKSAAKRQADIMRKEMEQSRRQHEAEMAALERSRQEAAARHEAEMAKQQARQNAADLQRRLAEEMQIRKEDDVVDIAPVEDVGTEDTKRKRKPLSLTDLLGGL